jgi:hypothetical protein
LIESESSQNEERKRKRRKKKEEDTGLGLRLCFAMSCVASVMREMLSSCERLGLNPRLNNAVQSHSFGLRLSLFASSHLLSASLINPCNHSIIPFGFYVSIKKKLLEREENVRRKRRKQKRAKYHSYLLREMNDENGICVY